MWLDGENKRHFKFLQHNNSYLESEVRVAFPLHPIEDGDECPPYIKKQLYKKQYKMI